MITKENKKFVSDLIDYYIQTASSYMDLACIYKDHTKSAEDVAFGMIAGSVYASFMQVYQHQQISPSLEDINEFNSMIKAKAQEIKKAVVESNKVK